MRCMRKKISAEFMVHSSQLRKIKRGFTLVEMLVVTVILSIVSLAIFTTFNNGIKIWQRVSVLLPEEDLDIFFDRFSSDVKNSLRFDGLKFTGTEYALELITIVNTPRFQNMTPGKVIYSYNQHSKIINREELDFSHIYTEEKGIATRSINNIKSFRLQYYFRDKERKQYFWQAEWMKEELPLAVRLELEFDDGSQIRKFTKTVSIPIAKSL